MISQAASIDPLEFGRDTERFSAVVIGASTGAIEAMLKILPPLPSSFPLPILVVVHIPPDKESPLAELLNARCNLRVCEAEDKIPIESGRVYTAAPNYHLLVENNMCLSLSNEEEVLFSRPSIDVLFESAADVYGERLLAIILTGANSDGAKGALAIQESGGMLIVQDPREAIASQMPQSAIDLCSSCRILSLQEISDFLLNIVKKNSIESR